MRGEYSMRKLIASRNLKRHCEFCNKEFIKGQVYYKKRIILSEDRIYSYESLICPKCKFKMEQHFKRFQAFKEKCVHPKEFIATEYSYIQGEAVKEPSYNYCQLCGKVL